MGAVDILRSFAETHCDDTEIVRDGIAYGVCRDAVAALAHKDRAIEALVRGIVDSPGGPHCAPGTICDYDDCNKCWLRWAEAEADRGQP